MLSFATALLALIQAPPLGDLVPVESAPFLQRVASLSKDFFNATEFFAVRPGTGIRAEGSARAEVERLAPWLEKMARPDLAKALTTEEWTAYKDWRHRVEPIVARTAVNSETIAWSFGHKVAALLVDRGKTTQIDGESDAGRFALSFLSSYLKLPERAASSVETYFKPYDGIWAGYVARGVYTGVHGTKQGPWEWDASFLVITDGRHVLARWNLTVPADEFGSEEGSSPQVVIPKTKSRFDK